MNPRQRRAVLLLVLSVVGLVVVFVLITSYVADVRKEVDPKVQVLALTRDATPYRSITDDMVRFVSIPERYAPPTALRDRAQLIDGVAASTLTRGSILQQGMLTPPPSLETGQRESAILVDASSGVAGKINPGSVVDIIATYDADANGGTDSGAKPSADVVVPAAKIIEVGTVRTKGAGGADQGQDPQQVVPVTFALSPKDSLRVSYAQTNAADVRLALRRPGDVTPLKPSEERFQRRATK